LPSKHPQGGKIVVANMEDGKKPAYSYGRYYGLHEVVIQIIVNTPGVTLSALAIFFFQAKRTLSALHHTGKQTLLECSNHY